MSGWVILCSLMSIGTMLVAAGQAACGKDGPAALTFSVGAVWAIGAGAAWALST